MQMSSLKDILKSLEEKLLEPKTRASMQELEILLAPEFREFASSGEIFNKAEVVASLLAEAPIERSLTNFDLIPLAADIALVTYKASKLSGDQGIQKNSLRSSVWRLKDGQWQMIFHQGTKLP
jgi:hypothetical protein